MFNKTLLNFAIVIAVTHFLGLGVLPSLAADCATADGPKFIFCSVTIGSETEINVFRSEAKATRLPNKDYLSGDKCILFHEFVRLPYTPPLVDGSQEYGPVGYPIDSNEAWNTSTYTYPWHQRMLEEDIPGYAGRKCDALLVSGHHDFSGGAGVAVTMKDDKCIEGYCLKRNQYVYSERQYQYESKFPPMAPNVRKTSPPSPLISNDPGPRLLLSQLVRTGEVCGKRYRTDDYPSEPSANSGKVMLSDLKMVFLFACNMAAQSDGPDPKGMFTDLVAVKLPKAPANIARVLSSEVKTRDYTFKERAQIIFGKALELYAFPAVAPGGDAVKTNLQQFLLEQVKPKYNNDTNYLTRHLEYLSAAKASNLSPAVRLPGASLITAPPACALKKFEPSCKMILTGKSDQDYTYVDPKTHISYPHKGHHVEECALDQNALANARANYCSDLDTFYSLWNKRTDFRRFPLRTFQIGDAASRFNDDTLSDYDLQWFF